MNRAGQVFYKMTGSGNDFIMLDGRYTQAANWPAPRIREICDRRLGVGADGLVILTPVAPGQVRMDFFNNDGSPAPMCGNAALCSSRLAAFLEMSSPESTVLQTGAGPVRTRCVGAGHMAELCLPSFPVPKQLDIPLHPGETGVFFGIVGVPHVVVLTEDVGKVDLLNRGRELRGHPAVGPGGANVNFVSPGADPGAPWQIRTYERGVEAETLACGTGTVASAMVAEAKGLRRLPGEWLTRLGIQLSVAGMLDNGVVTEAWLCGEGRLVYTGVLS